MIVIPTRLASTRFENKILCDIGGVPMFIATAKNASKTDKVLIAVDDEKVLKIAKEHGFDAVLTNPNHQSGTDRRQLAKTVLNKYNYQPSKDELDQIVNDIREKW